MSSGRRGGGNSAVSLDRHDLATITPSPTDADVVQTLQDRYSRDAVYTRLGARVLVSVNPSKALASVNDATCNEYVAEYRDTSGQRRILEPHIFQLAANAYLHMRRTGLDQSIVLCGETGSGKSENKKLIFKFFAMLRAQSKKEARLFKQVESSVGIMEAFGQATTIHQKNASRVGTFTELAFNERGRVIGAKLLDYVLEKSRVAERPSNERNFHIFYQIMAGATPDERQRWRLADASTYQYLGKQSSLRTPGADDALEFEQLRSALKTVGLGKKSQSQIFRTIAAILHLGNVQFADPTRKTTEESAYVRNDEVLATAAELFGLHARALEGVLTYKTQMIKSEMCTLFLNAEQCGRQRDDLARSLYGLLFSWIVEQINTKLCAEEQTNFIGILDLSGYQPDRMSKSSGGYGLGFETFLGNFACERVQSFALHELFVAGEEDMTSDGVQVPQVDFFDNAPCLDLFMKPRRGLFALMDKEMSRSSGSRPVTDEQFLQAFQKQHAEHDSFLAVTNRHLAFAVQHYAGQVTYDMDRFADKNADLLSADFVQLFRGNGGDLPGSANAFMVDLFEGKSVETEAHAQDSGVIVSARQSAKPTRSPSTRRMRKATDSDDDKDQDEKPSKKGKKSTRQTRRTKITGIGTQCSRAIGELVDTLGETLTWFVFCLRPNDQLRPSRFDAKYVRAQTSYLQLAKLAERRSIEYTVNCLHNEFLDRYAIVLAPMGIESSRQPKAKIQSAAEIFGWSSREMCVGRHRVWISDSAWRDLEDNLRAAENETRRRQKDGGGDDTNSMYSGVGGGAGALLAPPRAFGGGLPGAPSIFSDDQQSYISDDDAGQSAYGGGASSQYAGSSAGDAATRQRSGLGDSSVGGDGNKGMLVEQEEEEVPKMTGQRWRWLCFTWMVTWWVPPFCQSWCGMKRKDIQIAWREKVALCFIIFLACCAMLFFIVIFGPLVCPKQRVYTLSELSDFTGKGGKAGYTSIRGEVFDLSKVEPHHGVGYADFIKSTDYVAQDASKMFPVQLSALCDGVDGRGIPDNLSLQNYTSQGSSEATHDYRAYTGRQSIDGKDPYSQIMEGQRRRSRVAYIGWPPDYLKSQAQTGKILGIIDKQVFDLTDYLDKGIYTLTPDRSGGTIGQRYQFLTDNVESIFRQNPGQDITDLFHRAFSADADNKPRMEICLRNLFFVGVVDYRGSIRCQLTNYLLLAMSILLVAVIFFKFLAALQLMPKRDPEDHDRFVVCQIPCYTEGEDSLRETINSLAVLQYDDKRKLIFLICDGMIVGSGNDRSTPRIVLDILGVDPSMDPEPLSFLSLGEGNRQHNTGKVYTGLFECRGHVVPYLVVVKVGRPSERARPGNRGKRDSQMLLMRFFNAVHFDSEMTPLELEMYHQIKNVIGVEPKYYEYVMMVDADTFVMPDSLNRLVSGMLHDAKIMGICGETELANAKATWTTMIQVYEYYISHHMAKAFESLFGSVTCLPGCFCMYRMRTPQTEKPLLIANQVIQDYSENRVDTLHKKNLLALGEDRYLTTLMLKHFPQSKTVFTSDATCRTNAPDTWSVLLSQRRRWINSTVHNLIELLSLPRLCGFCCFSMRFVVFIDLLATIVQPSIVIYLVYLVYVVATSYDTINFVSLMMLAAIYGLQAIIFLLKRKWELVGYMIISIIALPVFSFFIPVYSFWHFDDFSWGNTRLVVGDKGTKKYVPVEEDKFDPRSIPRKKWSEYEQELWEVGTQGSHESRTTAVTSRTHESHGSYRSGRGPASEYGGMAPGVPPAMGGTGMDRPYSTAMTAMTGMDRPMSTAMYSVAPSQAMAPPQSGGYERRASFAVTADGSQLGIPGGDPYANNSRPTSLALSAMGGPMGGGGPGSTIMDHGPLDPNGYPSDDQILNEIRRILSTADLMSVTKKQVRDELSKFFGIDMMARKDYINQCIELILQGKL